MTYLQRNLVLASLLIPAFIGCTGSGGDSETPATFVDAEVTAVEPQTADPRTPTEFTLTGEGFVDPVRVFFFDDAGDVIASVLAEVSEDGTTATARTPTIDSRDTDGPGPVNADIGIENGDGSEVDCDAVMLFDLPSRSFDGGGNNEIQAELGSAGVALLRLVDSDYGDGVSGLAGDHRPSPRAISNAVCAQAESFGNTAGASDYVWQWGQFLDHDIDLTPEADPEEAAPIVVPAGDEHFAVPTISFHRSAYIAGSTPRQQFNAITSFIDASNVYGSDAARAEALRTNDGTGRLRTSDGDLLPLNETGLDNAGGTDAALFVAGDVRANEQAGLTSVHTLFLREHNRLADEIRERNPELNGDQVYEAARRIVGAQMQVITYREYLPLLLGRDALEPYRGYDETVDPTIANLFSTACYRMGHSQLPGQILRLDENGEEIAEGHLALRDAFFNPALIRNEGGIEPILRGLASQYAEQLDNMLIDDVRNFLFGPPGAGGFDLASLNIQRGRDHGLPSYNDVREALGLARRTSFAEVSSDPDTQARLAAAYESVDDIDLWVGGLCEDHKAGAMVGELLWFVIKDQFERLRDGDRFWYERMFDGRALAELNDTRLGDIIRRNTTIGSEIPRDVFRVGSEDHDRERREPRPLGDDRRRRIEDGIRR